MPLFFRTPLLFDPSRRRWFCLWGGLALIGSSGCSQARALSPHPLRSPATPGHHFRVTTFNIRYGSAPDGPQSWRFRREALVELLADLSSDFVGLQEAEGWQLEEILSGLPEYQAIGRGGGLFSRNGEFCAILYRRDRWSIGRGDSDTKWLSYTPTLPASRGYGAKRARILTWGRFKERKSGQILWIFNTHFDHRSARSRRVSARLTRRWMATALENDPPGTAYLLTGDLNAHEDSGPLKILLRDDPNTPIQFRDSLRAAQGSVPTFSTFSGFAPSKSVASRLDYVLVSPYLEVMNSEIEDRLIDGRLASDHHPVWADLTFRGPPKTST